MVSPKRIAAVFVYHIMAICLPLIAALKFAQWMNYSPADSFVIGVMAGAIVVWSWEVLDAAGFGRESLK